MTGKNAFYAQSGGVTAVINATPRIGVLWHASNEQEEAIYLGAFRQGLRDVGHVEGQTDNSRESLRWRAV